MVALNTVIQMNKYIFFLRKRKTTFQNNSLKAVENTISATKIINFVSQWKYKKYIKTRRYEWGVFDNILLSAQ